MNNRGQTLVEFVIILPIFLILLFYVIDFGRIIYSKNKLENNLNEVAFALNNDVDIVKINKSLGNKVTLLVNNSDGYKTVVLTEKIGLIAPGFNLILDNPYEVVVSRVIYDKSYE